MYTDRPERRPVRATTETQQLLWALTQNDALFDENGAVTDRDMFEQFEQAVDHYVAKLMGADVWVGISGGDEPGVDAAMQQDISAAASSLEWTRADSTLSVYQTAIRAFARYCLVRKKPVSPVPAHPKVVCAFLTRLSQPVMNPGTGQIVHRGMALGTLRGYLAAIDAVHAVNGYPKPGDVRQVKETMRKIGRRLGRQRPSLGKAAITLDQLAAMVGTTVGVDPTCMRDRALILILAHTGMSLASAADLQWSDVQIDSEEVRVPTSPEVTATLSASENPASDPVRTFQQWRALTGGVGGVFSQIGGSAGDETYGVEPLSAERLRQILRDRRFDTGQSPELSASTELGRRCLVEACEEISETRLADLRDRALLLVGFYTAMRRSNLADLQLRDIVDTPEGVDVAMRWSKTGIAHTFQLFQGVGDPLADPSRAVRDLVAAIGRERGVEDPVTELPFHPLFPGLSRNGMMRQLPSIDDVTHPDEVRERYKQLGMSTEAVAQVLKKRLARIGVDPKGYGAHSLRSGLITAMAEAGFTADQIKQVSLHKSLDVLFGYIRTATRRDGEMLHRLAIRRIIEGG